MSKELRQTMQTMILCGSYSTICIMATIICTAYFQSAEAISWLNVFTFIATIASLEYILIIQSMTTTALLLIIYEPTHFFLASLFIIAIGLIILVATEIHEWKTKNSYTTDDKEFLPVDPAKCGIIFFMATLVALLNDHEAWIGAQILGIMFTSTIAFAATEKLDSAQQ